MIWLATVMNGQQRPLAIPAFLALTGEAITAAAAAATRAIAAALVLAIAMAAFLLGHFYICRTEC